MRYPLRKTLLIAGVAVLTFTIAANAISPKHTELTKSASAVIPAPAPMPDSNIDNAESNATALYNEMGLAKRGLNEDAFELAFNGFSKLEQEGKLSRTDILTIVDFSQPSTKKRLYVIDLDEKKILFQSVVSHGRNTGTLWAKSFSNQTGSYKSSPGFYVTAETYNGGNGYSLRLDGLENGINHMARSRAIVMHGAQYANESTINSLGFLGRSQGCPALPQALTRPVINTIKGGSCLFIYTPGEDYVRKSSIV